VPRLLIALFEKISTLRQEFAANDYHVEVSMLEIYNEKVRDLLRPRNGGFVKVREVGEYFRVLNLTTVVVHSREEVEQVAAEGKKITVLTNSNIIKIVNKAQKKDQSLQQTKMKSHRALTRFSTSVQLSVLFKKSKKKRNSRQTV